MPITKEQLLSQARENIEVVDSQQGQDLMEQGAIIVDVREPAEFNTGHIPNAVHIPRGLLEFMVGNHPALKDMEPCLLVYCKNGGRSTLACDVLQKMGFKQVRMLAGGFDDWKGTVHTIEIPDNQYPG